MKIINKTLPIEKNIDQIKPGELFTTMGNRNIYGAPVGLFMKIENKNGDENAVKIDNGELYLVDRNTILQIIDGELIV